MKINNPKKNKQVKNKQVKNKPLGMALNTVVREDT